MLDANPILPHPTAQAPSRCMLTQSLLPNNLNVCCILPAQIKCRLAAAHPNTPHTRSLTHAQSVPPPDPLAGHVALQWSGAFAIQPVSRIGLEGWGRHFHDAWGTDRDQAHSGSTR